MPPQTNSCLSTLSQSYDAASKGMNAYSRSIALPFARVAIWVACHETDGWAIAGDIADCVVSI